MRNKIILSSLAAVLLLVSSSTPALADTITTTGTKTASVDYSRDSSFTITIPKNIEIDKKSKTGTYEISVSGDIKANETLSVSPNSKVSMTDTTSQNNVDVDVTQIKSSFNYSDVANNSITTGQIDGSNLTSGIWEGTLNFSISLQ
mgnify:FL=1|jgi:hypothetical protein